MNQRVWQRRVEEGEAGERLDRALSHWLTQALGAAFTRSQAKGLLDQGAVYLNGQRVRIASKVLRAGARVEVRCELGSLVRPVAALWNLTKDHILYEDEDLIAINKPSGLPSQATRDPARDHLYAAVIRYAQAQHGVNAYVGLHHRLDTGASGVVLMTCSRRANAGTMALFRDRLAQKVYRAITYAADVPDVWERRGPLRRLGPEGQGDDGRWAESEMRVLERWPSGLHVEVSPHTGRRHQVRLHLALSGAPIMGDAAYALPAVSAPVAVPRLMLHAHSLSFRHPISGQPLVITSPIPQDFCAVIAALSAH